MYKYASCNLSRFVWSFHSPARFVSLEDGGRKNEKRVMGCELQSITSPEDDGFDIAPKPPVSPSLSTLLHVITVRRFTAGRLFYSKIHVDGRIRGHSNTEFPREQNGTNIPSRNLLSVAEPRGRFIARVNSPGWETPDVMDRKPTPTSPLSSQCRACATGEPDRVFD